MFTLKEVSEFKNYEKCNCLYAYKDVKLMYGFITLFNHDMKELKKNVLRMGIKNKIQEFANKKSWLGTCQTFERNEFTVDKKNGYVTKLRKCKIGEVDYYVEGETGFLFDLDENIVGKYNFKDHKIEKIDKLEIDIIFNGDKGKLEIAYGFNLGDEENEYKCVFHCDDYLKNTSGENVVSIIKQQFESLWLKSLQDSRKDTPVKRLLDFMGKLNLKDLEEFYMTHFIAFRCEIIHRRNELQKEEEKKKEQKKLKKLQEIEERRIYLASLKQQNEEKLKTQVEIIDITKEEERLRLKEKEEKELLRIQEEREREKAERLERHKKAQEKKAAKLRK